MPLVSFEQVTRLTSAATAPINPTMNGALGPLTGAGQRSTLYDNTWGYFTFGQSLRTEYHDVMTYMDHGEFTIQGEFNIEAEDASLGNVESTTDDARFTRVLAKYNALELLFETAAKATAPLLYNLWGGISDNRCIPLPWPLVDDEGNRIYTVPIELVVEPGQWGRFIRYKATLKEAKFTPVKLHINGVFLDDGVVSITCPKPIMSRSTMVGCCGEVIQVRNYAAMELEVTGSVNGIHASGYGMTKLANDVINDCITELIDIGVVRILPSNDSGTVARQVMDYLFIGMSNDQGSGVDIDYPEQMVRLNLKAKAGKI